jgi:hypothetical protein
MTRCIYAALGLLFAVYCCLVFCTSLLDEWCEYVQKNYWWWLY